MKATHIKWSDMWEENFSNYPGLVSIMKDACSGKIHLDAVDEAQISIPYRFINDSDEIMDTVGSLSSSNNDSCPEFDIKEKSSNFHSEEGTSAETVMVESECKNITHESMPEPGTEQDTHEENEVNEKPPGGEIVRCTSPSSLPKEIIFECESGQGFAFTTNNSDVLTYTHSKTCFPKTLGIIAIDTSCLKRPKIKVLFSCNIHFIPRGEEAAAQLEFILSRSCNNGHESHIGNWLFDTMRNERISQSFKFNFCSCNSFPGCYNYYVRVIPVFIKNCCVCITGCHMDAVAQSS